MRMWVCPSCGGVQEFEEEELAKMFCQRCKKYVKPKKGRVL